MWSSHKREVVYETPKIIVVDTKIDPAPWTRSLYFKSTPTVTQSEIALQEGTGTEDDIGTPSRWQRTPIHDELLLVPQQVLGLGLLQMQLQPEREDDRSRSRNHNHIHKNTNNRSHTNDHSVHACTKHNADNDHSLNRGAVANPPTPIMMDSALVIGTGGGAVPMALRRMCGSHVDTVDMSADVIAAAKVVFGCTSDNTDNSRDNNSGTWSPGGAADVELMVADGLDVLLGKVQVGARSLHDYDYILIDVDAGLQTSAVHDERSSDGDAGHINVVHAGVACTAPHPAFLAPDVLAALANARKRGKCQTIAINAVGDSQWIESTAAVLFNALGGEGATVVKAAGNVLFLWGNARLPTSASGMLSAMKSSTAAADFAGPGLHEWVSAVANAEHKRLDYDEHQEASALGANDSPSPLSSNSCTFGAARNDAIFGLAAWVG